MSCASVPILILYLFERCVGLFFRKFPTLVYNKINIKFNYNTLKSINKKYSKCFVLKNQNIGASIKQHLAQFNKNHIIMKDIMAIELCCTK